MLSDSTARLHGDDFEAVRAYESAKSWAQQQMDAGRIVTVRCKPAFWSALLEGFYAQRRPWQPLPAQWGPLHLYRTTFEPPEGWR